MTSNGLKMTQNDLKIVSNTAEKKHKTPEFTSKLEELKFLTKFIYVTKIIFDPLWSDF